VGEGKLPLAERGQRCATGYAVVGLVKVDGTVHVLREVHGCFGGVWLAESFFCRKIGRGT